MRLGEVVKNGELLMKNLVRGAVALSILSVVFIYAQTKTDAALVNANDSQIKIENAINSNTLVNQDDDKKLVKKTVSSRSTFCRER